MIKVPGIHAIRLRDGLARVLRTPQNWALSLWRGMFLGEKSDANILKQTVRLTAVKLSSSQDTSSFFMLAESAMSRYDETGLMFITIGLTKGRQRLLNALIPLESGMANCNKFL